MRPTELHIYDVDGTLYKSPKAPGGDPVWYFHAHSFGAPKADGRLALTTELYSMDSGYREGDLRAMRDWARGIGWTVQNRGTKESFWYPGKTTLFVLREVRAVIPFREETTYDRRP